MSTPSPSGRKMKSVNMNRPVSNLNRANPKTPQNSNGSANLSGMGLLSGAGPSTPTGSPTGKKVQAHRSSTPQPTTVAQEKEVLEPPDHFTVRPAPANAKVERNDQRMFINRGAMEQMGLHQGSVVSIQKFNSRQRIKTSAEDDPESTGVEDGESTDAEEEDGMTEQITVGVTWPMEKIERTLVRLPLSLRQAARLQVGDSVVILPYRSPIEEARDVVLEEETADAPAEREALRFYLGNELPRYLSVGMHLECSYRGILRSFIVKSINSPEQPSLVDRLENLSLTATKSTSTGPQIFSMSRATIIRFTASPPSTAQDSVTFSSIGGLKLQIEIVRDMVEMPLLKPHLFLRFGMKPPRGVLLYGPPGTGKTLLLRAIANETKAHVLTVNGPSVISKYQGETESTLRSIFTEAMERQPSIIFIDEIDALAPKRGGENDSALDVTDGRVVATLLTLMDGMEGSGRVVVVAATNRPNAIDPALRRPGRFDKELEIGIPDANARLEILKLQLEKMPHALEDEYVASVAAKTHGYVGADLIALCTEAGMHCIKNGVKNNLPEEEMKIVADDIDAALLVIRASAMREIFLETPKVKWSDIGGHEDVKRKLREAVDWPLNHPESFVRLGITPPKGILLYGPPGCSKTLMAKALATETGMNFFAVKGPEVFNKYVGESERTIREIFRKARAASPSIIFFDEIDAMTTTRGGSSGAGVGDRILTALLNEMDGIEALRNVTVLAATNRPDVIDSALMRPGRIDRILYVGPPNLETRKDILHIEFRRMAIASDVNIDELAVHTDGCSGAEISALCRDAGIQAMYEDLEAREIKMAHFDAALQSLGRSIGLDQLQYFEAFRLHSGVKSI